MEGLNSPSTKKFPATLMQFLLLTSTIYIKTTTTYPLDGQKPLTVQVGETITFDLSSPVSFNEEYIEIKLTLKSVKSLYEPTTKYKFYEPNINLNCNCTCSDQSLSSCRIQDLTKYDECENLQNTTTSCNNFEHNGMGLSFCPKNFHVCCQVYFTANKSEPFHAIQLLKQNTEFDIELLLKSASGNVERTSIKVFKNMNRILVKGILITLHPVFEEESNLENSLFYKQSENATLRYTSHINKKHDEELKKIGWFQENGGDLMLQLGKPTFEEAFKVDMKNCNGTLSVFTWNFDAMTDYKNSLKTLKDIRSPFDNLKITNGLVTWDHTMDKIKASIRYSKHHDNVFQTFLQVKSNVEESILYFVINSSDVFNVSIIMNRTTTIFQTLYHDNAIETTTKKFCHERVLGQINDVELWVCFQNVKEMGDPLCKKPRIVFDSSNLCEMLEMTTAYNRNYEEKSNFNSLSEIPKTKNNHQDSSLVSGLIWTTGIFFVLLVIVISVLIWKWRKNKNHEKKHEPYHLQQLLTDELANGHDASSDRNFNSSNDSNTTEDNLEDFIMKFMKKQKENIKNLHIKLRPGVSDLKTFMNKWYVKLDLVEINRNQMSELPVDFKELFHVDNSKQKFKRIAIEGDHGCGKTTLLFKLAHDWTKEGSSINKQFRMIFFVTLEDNFTNSSMENLLKTQFNELELDENKGMECVKAHLDNVLLLFDGYDQMNDASKTHFHEVLGDEEYENTTMVITRRQEITQIKEKTAYSSSLAAKTKKDFFQKTILIKGIA